MNVRFFLIAFKHKHLSQGNLQLNWTNVNNIKLWIKNETHTCVCACTLAHTFLRQFFFFFVGCCCFCALKMLTYALKFKKKKKYILCITLPPSNEKHDDGCQLNRCGNVLVSKLQPSLWRIRCWSEALLLEVAATRRLC